MSNIGMFISFLREMEPDVEFDTMELINVQRVLGYLYFIQQMNYAPSTVRNKALILLGVINLLSFVMNFYNLPPLFSFIQN